MTDTIPPEIMAKAEALFLCSARAALTTDALEAQAGMFLVVGRIAEALKDARDAERERCAQIAETFMQSADAQFDQRVGRARRGEKNLELAAATAAGMSHASRKIAAAIRTGDTGE